MSRETYIFIINPEKAKRNLIKEIEFNKTYSISLKDFIERSNQGELEFEKSIYENIIEKIKTDFGKIRRHELAVIFYWLRNDYFNLNHNQEQSYLEYEAIFYTKLKEFGIELVYEFEQKDKCKIFMYQLGQFEYLNKLGIYSEDDNWSDYQIGINQFKEYLNYLLLLLCKIEIEEDGETRVLTNILKELETNVKIQNQVNYSWTEIKEEEDNDYKYCAEPMINVLIAIKNKLINYNGKIFVIDSQ